MLVAQSCLTLCNLIDCNLPGSSVHGIFQARILEWVAISFSRGIFPTQGLNPGISHCRQTLYHLSHQGSFPRHINNWASCPLWFSCFIPSGTIGNFLLFPSSILDTFRPGGLIFQCHIFWAFYTVHEVLMVSILGWFAFPSRGSHFISTLCYDPCILGGPTCHGS